MSTTKPIDMSELDGFFAEKMAAYRIPGAVFVLIQNGKVVITKGYGISDLSQQSPVTADETLFHLGSIAKLMTATAVMQLVEQGKLDLDADVNDYLRDFQIADTYPQPVTLFGLLTHTSGLEQHTIGTGARGVDDYVSLSEYLQRRPPQRLMQPGQVIIYSSVGVAIAGQVVEDVTDRPFSEYAQRHIFQPLRMSHSSFVEPPNYPIKNAATGYRYQGGDYIPYTESYYSLIAPGGDFVSTGLDMANFMLAHLGNGRLGEVQLLQPTTVHRMHTQQFAQHPKLRGRAIGFSEWFENGQRAVFHDGGAPGFLSRVFLVPEHHWGFFVAYNNGYAYNFSRELTSKLMDMYFPASDTSDESVAPEPNPTPSISQFTGYYRDHESSPTDISKLSTLLNQIPVKAIDRQHIRIGSSEYARVTSTSFQSSTGTSYAAFRTEKDQITHLFLGTAAYEKLNRYETQPVQLGLLIILGLTFLATTILPFFTNLSLHPSSTFWWYAGIACALNLVFLVGLSLTLRSVLSDTWVLIYGLTPTIKPLLIIPLITSVLALGLVILVFLGWKNGYWSLIGRLYYTWVTIAALGFILFLKHWNLLVLSR